MCCWETSHSLYGIHCKHDILIFISRTDDSRPKLETKMIEAICRRSCFAEELDPIEVQTYPATLSPSIRFCTLRPCDHDLWYFDLESIILVGYPKTYIVWSLKTLGSFVFELCCGQTNKQRNRLTRKSILPTPTDIVNAGNDETFVNVEKFILFKNLVIKFHSLILTLCNDWAAKTGRRVIWHACNEWQLVDLHHCT